MHGSTIPVATTTERPGAASSDTTPIRPRLRHDVVFADSGQDGVFVRHSDGGFMLTGRTAYTWLSALSPYLNGQHTLDDLCAGLTEERRAMVTMIVNTLLERGFARDAKPGEERLTADVAEAFRRQLDFVAHYSDDEHVRFSRFRDARILVVGPGSVVTAAAVNLLRNGAGRVDVACAAGATVAADVAARVGDLGDVAGSAVAWHRSVPTAAELDGLDAVAVVVTPATSRLVCDLLTRGGTGGPVVFPVTPVADRIVFGPVTRPATAPCWACAMLRLPASVDPGAVADLWRSAALPGGGDHTSVGTRTAGMVGSEMAFELFRFLTGCLVAETDGSVLVQDRLTMETRREQLLPHPRCPVCTGFPVRLADEPAPLRSDLAQPAADGDPHPFKRAFDLLSPHVGIVLEYTDDRFDQAPVKAARIRLSQAAPDGGPAEMAAFHIGSLSDARTVLLDRALPAYVDAVGAPSTSDTVATPGIPVDRLFTATGLPVADGPLVAATSLVTGAVVGVPAAAVHPFHAVNASGGVERTAAGHGGGETQEQARTAGLLSALAYRAVLAACSGAPATRLAFTGLDQDTHAALWFLLRSVEQFDQRADVLLLTDGPAPVVLAVVHGGVTGDGDDGGRTWAVAAGTSLESAAVDALTDAVGRAQLAREDEPAWAGPPLLADFDPRTVEPGTTAEFDSLDGPAVTVPDIVDALRASGYDVLAADTTTRDLRAAGPFVTERVLIVGAGRGPHRPR